VSWYGRGTSEPTGGTRVPGSLSETRRQGRRVLWIWVSVEFAAGIVALVEIVFALPSVILLQMGRATAETVLPPTIVSGVIAVYLGWCAFPLVGQVAQLGRHTP
jgi:hypothetical protein